MSKQQIHWQDVVKELEKNIDRIWLEEPVELRRVVNGVIFRLRTGCQWNSLPRIFGDDSTVHRWFQRFAQDGVLEELWSVLVSECEELGALDWSWQAADGCIVKAPFGKKGGLARRRPPAPTPPTGASPAPSATT